MKKIILISVLLFNIAFSGVFPAGAIEIGYMTAGGLLGNAPDYDWWYGCSPTSAGMMVGYYDNNGYQGARYDNLVPGGAAELSTFSQTTAWNALANNVIASQGNVNDFYGTGYGGAGDDTDPATWHSFNSLADFMGTSQDSVGNTNGSTTFYYWDDGSKFTAQNALDLGVSNNDGMYGILEYMEYAGYGAAQLYTQATDNWINTEFSFTFNNYMTEIDAGRVVMILVEGHSMFGYGYGDNQSVYLHDTWSLGPHEMTWGQSYASLDMRGVVVLEPTGGSPVPLPATIFLIGPGLMLVALFRRQFRFKNRQEE